MPGAHIVKHCGVFAVDALVCCVRVWNLLLSYQKNVISSLTGHCCVACFWLIYTCEIVECCPGHVECCPGRVECCPGRVEWVVPVCGIH